jgi:4-amino-4-deoxy-L-arabinose transferase-like glycosyltransferase
MIKEMSSKIKKGAVDKFWIYFISILILGLLVRILWLIFDPHEIVSDEVAYQRLAMNLVQGKGYGIPFWPPGYPLVLAVLYFLFGSSPKVAIVFNLILSLLILVTSFLVARKLFNGRIAIISMFIMAIMPSYILTISLVRYEILLQFCLVLTLLLSLNKWRFLNMVGIALLSALATLIRPLIIFWPVLLYLINTHQGSLTSRIKKGGLTLALTSVFILPWIAYASSTAGRFVPIALNGGMNLWIGNNPQATGAYISPPGNFWDPQNDALASREAIDYITSHPVQTIKLLPFKIFYSLNRENWPVDWIFMKTYKDTPQISYEFLSKVSNVYYIVVSCLAVASIIIILQKRQYSLLLPIFLLVYSIAGQLPFFGSPRFRWIAQFVIIFYAAYFLPILFLKVKSRIRKNGSITKPI